MKKFFAVLAMVAILSGCAETLAILDVLADKPKPAPVCEKETVGVRHDGKVCLKFDDGKYRWAAEK